MTVVFFGSKVKDIQFTASTATSPDVQAQPTSVLCHIPPVSCKEVANILARMQLKSCSLDPMPSRMVRKMQDVLIPVI